MSHITMRAIITEKRQESPFGILFGSYPQIKIIETLALHPDSEYNLTELAECSDVSKAIVFQLKDKLLHYKIMKPMRKVGNITLYKFDRESPTGKLIDELTFKLAEVDIEQLMREYDAEELERSRS